MIIDISSSVPSPIKYDVAELSGSDKQVAWANSLRHNAAMMISQLLSPRDPNHANNVKSVEAWLSACNDSRYWIDNRGTPARIMYKSWLTSNSGEGK